MATSKKNDSELVSAPSAELIATLQNEFPVEPGFQRVLLPRIAFKAQDVMEGQGKSKVVTTEAGTFLLEIPTDEEDDFGKKVWEKREIGSSFEATIIYNRKQLRYYDEATQTFTSSPIFDKDDEVIPLFRDKAEIAKDTATNLKAREEYAGLTLKGKPKSLLEDNSILYVLYEGELYQMSIRGGSMYAYKSYVRSVRPGVPLVVTRFDSEPQSKGSINWNQMTFNKVRDLSNEEATDVVSRVMELKQAISDEKEFYNSKNPTVADDPLAAEFNSR